MEDKKAKFIIYVVICLIAFMCSSTVYSMTGGLSDWLVSSVGTNEDVNNNGYLDSSEGQYYSSSDGQYYDDSGSNDNGGFIDGIFSSSDSDSNDYSSSEEEPDFLARIVRYFIGDNSATDTSYDSGDSYDSNYYYEDTSSGIGDGRDFGLSELFDKVNNKLDQMFNQY